MARLVSEFDWSSTGLGPPSKWSASLNMIVRFVLANRIPMLLWWGPDYIQIYNDAYAPILGAKHPRQSLGQPFRECWNEVFDVLGPLVDVPFNGGPATYIDDIELVVHRHGFAERAISPSRTARCRTIARRAASAVSSELSSRLRRRFSASAG